MKPGSNTIGQLTHAEEKILVVLARKRRAYTKQIAEAIGRSQDTTLVQLHQLREAGRVVQDGHGSSGGSVRWRLPGLDEVLELEPPELDPSPAEIALYRRRYEVVARMARQSTRDDFGANPHTDRDAYLALIDRELEREGVA